MNDAIRLTTKDGDLMVEPNGGSEKRLLVRPNSKDYFVNRREFVTAYPIELIQTILDIKGLDYVCDEIARDEDPKYVAFDFETGMFPFVPRDAFKGKRLLDFGCGAGASTMNLRRMLPDTEIVGVELEESLLSIAKARAAFYGYADIRLLRSPSGEELPPDIGTFDFVVMHAVLEHLLPDERKIVMPMLWRAIRPGGVLFIDATPNRMCPVENHTTGLPLINYLPDAMARSVALKFSNRVAPDESWSSLLRRGIRGGSHRELRRLITSARDGAPQFLPVSQGGLQDDFDLWIDRSQKIRKSRAKDVAFRVFKTVHALSGISMLPDLTLAIRKTSS